jgi:Putative phage tail protein
MSATLASIVSAICERCGLTAYDVTDLENISVHGFKIDRVTDGRSVIAVLRQIGFFDSVESGGVLKFTRRGKAPVRTLTVDDMGVHEYGNEPPAAVSTKSTQDVELPRQLFVQYRDPGRDYEDGQQASPTRLITDAINDKYVDVAVAIDATQALRAAEIMWADEWAGRWQHALALDASHADLEPTDVLLVPVDGRLERMRIVSAEDSAVMLRSLQLVRDDDGSYVSSAVPDPPARSPAPLRILAATTLVLLDLPPLRSTDTDGGFYAAAQRTGSGNAWGGAAIYRGLPGGALNALASVTSEAVVGTLSMPIAAGPHTIFDDSAEIVVELPRGQFESRPDADLLEDGANTLAVGVNGRWELVQFGDAQQTGPTSWVLSHLLRGRRGSDHNIGASQVGDTVVLVSGNGIVRLPLPVADVGTELIYRGVTIGATLGSGTDQSYASTGESLKPFSPVHVEFTAELDGDLLIEWTRRDRLAIEFEPGPLPLSDTPEAYEVDILGDGSPEPVLRTLSTSTPSVTYTLAQQLDDFGSPGAPTAFAVRIYQLGQLGRGTPREAIL